MSLQERLKQLFDELKKEGTTATDIANEADVRISRISEVLNNLVKPSAKFLLKLSHSKSIQTHLSLNEAETASTLIFWYLNDFFEKEKVVQGFKKVIQIEK